MDFDEYLAEPDKTPRRFIHCVVTIKMSERPLVLFFDPKRYECSVQMKGRTRRPGTIRVGTYGPGGGKEVVKEMRLDLYEVINRCERGTSEFYADSTSCD